MPRGVQQNINRRRFLGATAAAAGLAALQACAPAASTPTPSGSTSSGGSTAAPTSAASAPAATAAPSGGVPTVYTMVDKTWADVGMLAATERYNEAHASEVQIKLEETAQGWDTKVLAQIREKNLRWSAHGYAPFFDQYKYIKAGLVQPLDDLLKSSKVPWGPNQKEVYFTERIYEALLFEGKQYFIPMKANVHICGWRQDYLEAAGYDTMPKTWDEVEVMLVKMKAALEQEQVTPFAIQRDIFRALGTMFTTFIEKPFDDEGVLKFESPEWIALIEMVKKWLDQGLARIDATADSTDIWQKGKVAMSLGSHSWVRLGRQVWGPEKVKGGRPPKANASAPDRTWIHIDGGFVFPNAPHPQEATDWLLTILGPEGEPADAWWSGTATFSGSPVHQQQIDRVLKDKPEYSEVYDMMSVVPNSHIITIPVAGAYAITEAKMWPWLDRFFKGEVKATEAMANVRKEVDDELAKQMNQN